LPTYNIRVGRSQSITGPYLDKDGRDMKDEGDMLSPETAALLHRSKDFTPSW